MAKEIERGGATKDGFYLAFPPELPSIKTPQSAVQVVFLVREYRDGKPVNPWVVAVGKSTDTARKMRDRYEEMGLGDRLVIKAAIYRDGLILPVELPRVHDGVERKKSAVYVQDWNLASESVELYIQGLIKGENAPVDGEEKKQRVRGARSSR